MLLQAARVLPRETSLIAATCTTALQAAARQQQQQPACAAARPGSGALRRCLATASAATAASLAAEMRAIRFNEIGGPEVLNLVEAERPTPGKGAVLIENKAIGVNFIDTYFRTGLYPAPLPASPGVEGAGIVVELGPDTDNPQGLKPGDRVAYISPGPRLPGSSSYAEFTAVPAATVAKLPDGLSFDQGAALLLQGLTAVSMIEVATDVKAGDWALVHAAAGGTGQLLTQWLRRIGARVIGTTSTEEKAEIARAAGAEEVILYSRPGADVPTEVARITGGAGARAAFDGVGKDTFDASLASLGYLGWLVSFGNASGKVPPVDLLRLGDKGVRLLRPSLFTTLKARDGLFAELASKLLDAAAAGEITQSVFKVFPLDEAADAHRALEGRGTTGKLLLQPSGGGGGAVRLSAPPLEPPLADPPQPGNATVHALPVDGALDGAAAEHHQHHRQQRHRHHRQRRASTGGRCAGTVGSWCGPFYTQTPVAYKAPPVLGKPCPGEPPCSGVGVCHGDSGTCDCPAGWGGPDCSAPLKRPCTNGVRIPRTSPNPRGFIGPDKRDLDWLAGGITSSRCAGICDDDMAACYCDPKLGNPKLGRIPPPPGSPPGTPPLQEGRPLVEPCSRPSDDGKGNRLKWGVEGVAYSKVYGPEGWCVADEPKDTVCGCPLDGFDGPGCNMRTETVCPNQCSGRGRCRLGFCHCNPGWWGLDCAHAATPEAAATPRPPLASWLSGLAVDAWRCASSGQGCLGVEALEAIDEEWSAELEAGEGAASSAGTAGGGDAQRQVLGQAQQGLQQQQQQQQQQQLQGAEAESGGDGRGLWRLGGGSPNLGGAARQRRLRQRRLRRLQGEATPAAGAGARASKAASPQASTAAGGASTSAGAAFNSLNSRDPWAGTSGHGSSGASGSGVANGSGGGGGSGGSTSAAGRLRPLIYVYDVPSIYVARMLSYRMIKDTCTWRNFYRDNSTVIGFFTYASEMALLDFFLSSPHRTLDPEEADFFFVPVFSACYFNPVFAWADYPWFYAPSFQRVNHAVMMTHEALQWVKASHPYWNRTGGADHIWHFAHDEGACWAPAEVYERSIILSHWGRLDKNHTSGTSYGPDDYSKDVLDDPFVPGGFGRVIGRHPCYTPGKDLVLPSFEGPSRYHASPYLGAHQPPRDILLFHRGRMGQRDLPAYSRGVRQKILRLAEENDWKGRYNILVGAHVSEDEDYSQQLARSLFCLVASGDGWTSRFDDAVLHGCIPVIVIDWVVGPWGHQLRWPAFSVRVPEAEVERLPEILREIQPARVRQMQRTLATVWRRFAWLGHPEIYKKVREAVRTNREALAALQQQQQQQAGGAGGGGDAGATPGGGAGAAGPSATASPLPPPAAAGQQVLHELRPGQWRDDAFGTLLQWLHHKLEVRERRAAPHAAPNEAGHHQEGGGSGGEWGLT